MNISRYISEISLCDWWFADDTVTLYFEAPLDSFNSRDRIPEAVFMTISLEFPTNSQEPRDTTVCYSPTIYDSEDDSYSDIDWNDVDMPYEDIEKLFEVAEGNADYLRERGRNNV